MRIAHGITHRWPSPRGTHQLAGGCNSVAGGRPNHMVQMRPVCPLLTRSRAAVCRSGGDLYSLEPSLSTDQAPESRRTASRLISPGDWGLMTLSTVPADICHNGRGAVTVRLTTEPRPPGRATDRPRLAGPGAKLSTDRDYLRCHPIEGIKLRIMA